MRTGSLAPRHVSGDPGSVLGPGWVVRAEAPSGGGQSRDRLQGCLLAQPPPQLRLLYLRHSAAAGAAFPVAPVLLTTGQGLAGSWAAW